MASEHRTRRNHPSHFLTADGSPDPDQWIELRAKDHTGRWEENYHGPFPCTIEEWNSARAEFKVWWDGRSEFDQLTDCCPASFMREIMRKHCKRLSTFDLLVMSNQACQGFTPQSRSNVPKWSKRGPQVKRYGDKWPGRQKKMDPEQLEGLRMLGYDPDG